MSKKAKRNKAPIIIPAAPGYSFIHGDDPEINAPILAWVLLYDGEQDAEHDKEVQCLTIYGSVRRLGYSNSAIRLPDGRVYWINQFSRTCEFFPNEGVFRDGFHEKEAA